jgi:hypothetical protein
VSTPVELPLPDCGCCQGAHALTPAALDNPAGASSLRYRVGTAATFLATMQSAAEQTAALRRLRTGRTDDPAVALLDAWACALDVLAFYSERIANEGFLRTAGETGSLVELARTVGYERAPGRAASASLAFTLEEGLGAPPLVPIAAGTRVASLPGPGELPQSFETLAELEARPAWNALLASTSVPAPLEEGATFVHLPGTVTDLQPGDALLVVEEPPDTATAPTAWALRTVGAVTPLPSAAVTRVEWADPLGAGEVGDPVDMRVYALRQRAALFGHNAPDWQVIPDQVREHYYLPGFGEVTAVASALAPGTGDPGGVVIKQPTIFKIPLDWPNFGDSLTRHQANTVDLDADYPKIVEDSWLVLQNAAITQLYRVSAAVPGSRADFALSTRVTTVTLRHGADVGPTFNGGRRTTAVLAQSERLDLADTPRTDPVQGDRIDLAVPVPPLAPGRALLVSGKRPRLRVGDNVRDLTLLLPGGDLLSLDPGAELVVTGPGIEVAGGVSWPVEHGEDAGTVTATGDQLVAVPPADDDPVQAELAAVAEPATTAETVTELRLAAALKGAYDRASLRVAANVAPGSHGETKSEVLGSGDATVAFQRFQLAQAPLTYLGTSVPGGVASTLEVRVDGVRWTEVASLHGSGPGDRVYVVRADADGKVTLTFGDGVTGARLPTGSENVTATYRVGIGLAGVLPAERLTLLLTRPLGVRGVGNPLPTGLAADPDAPEALRRNAPDAARRLDRVVSLADYEDFARATAGIGKAHVGLLAGPDGRFLHLTVAGEGGQVVDEQARTDLVTALLAAGDPHQPLMVDPAEPLTFDLAATVFTDPLLAPGTVKAAVAAALTEAFGFDARGLGQPVTASEVGAAVQRVAGVVAVTLTTLDLTGNVLDALGNQQTPATRTVIPAKLARLEGAAVKPAQLLTLRAEGLALVEAT